MITKHVAAYRTPPQWRLNDIQIRYCSIIAT